jgi:transposase
MAMKRRRSTPEEKLAAVRMLKSGTDADEVARIFEVSRAIVYRWQQNFDRHGPSALEIKKAPGRTPSLSVEQRAKIFALIAGSNPLQMQLDFGELWTRKNVQEMIRREFGVKLSLVQVGRVLRDIGLSPQKPLYRSYRQNPELVEEWKKVIYPKLRRRAAEEGAVILFGDEASVRTDHHAGTTWSPVGQTPVVRDSGTRVAVKMISAISQQGMLRFQVHVGSMNGGRFIEFLKSLMKSVDAKKIFLVVDGSSVHKSKKVKAFLEKDQVKERLELFILPGYSPELNPDEWVWNNVKNTRIKRVVSHSQDDLKSKAIGALRRLQKMPELIRSFFRDPDLAYIAGLSKELSRVSTNLFSD